MLSISNSENSARRFDTQLGDLIAARRSADAVRRLWPDFEQEIYAGHLEKWMFAQPDLIEHIVEGLEKAGLLVQRSD
jgi:hypothetical protein